jgi:hypothetical protein
VLDRAKTIDFWLLGLGLTQKSEQSQYWILDVQEGCL